MTHRLILGRALIGTLLRRRGLTDLMATPARSHRADRRCPHQTLEAKEAVEALRREMRIRLTYRERHIVGLRFGFWGDPMTLSELGSRFGVHRETIRRTQAIAIEKLRRSDRLSRVRCP